MSVRDSLGWVLRAGLAVWELHAEGVPHGRLSAKAILIEEQNCRSKGRLLRPAELKDDPAFFSLPRADGGGPSLPDDVWALGCTLYIALTGQVPYPSGVAAAIEGDRLRPPRPLAVHRAELDVMQPVVDRLIRADYSQLATTIEDLVFGLRDFSPTIKDLEALPLERPSNMPQSVEVAIDMNGNEVFHSDNPAPLVARRSTQPSGSGRPKSGRPSVQAESAQINKNTLYAVIASLVLAGALYALWSSSGDDTVAETTPPAPTPKPKPRPKTPAKPTAAPTAVATSAPQPVDEHGGDLVACTSSMFASDAYGKDRISIDFPCGVRDAKTGVYRLTGAVARGAAGEASKTAKEWNAIGWYQAAAFAVAREHCCDKPAPVQTERLFGMCKIDKALDDLAKSANRGSDDQLAQALDDYRAAIHCALLAGGGPYFGQDTPPTTGEAAMFLRMLTRLRAAKR